MAVTYTTAVKNARLDAVTAQAGTTAVLEIGTAGMASVLATIPLANPIAPGASGGVLTLTMPQSDTSADATGTAAAARIRTASGGTDIVLDSTSITAGQTVTINSATITHA